MKKILRRLPPQNKAKLTNINMGCYDHKWKWTFYLVNLFSVEMH